MNVKTRNVLIATVIATAVGATGVAVADMGGYGAGCAQTQPGQGPAAMMSGMHGAMMSGMHGGMHNMMNGMHTGMHSMMGGTRGNMAGQGMQQQGMRSGMGYGLDLSDEQRTEMGEIRQDFLPKMGELRGRMQANHEQMRALRQGGSMDQAAIAALADQKGEMMAEMIKLHAAHMARMESLLTEEQREQMRLHRQGMGMDDDMMGSAPNDG